MAEPPKTFEQQEKARLAKVIPPRKITTCQDETFHPEPCLVALEPVSNFDSAGTAGAHADRGRMASGDGRGARGLASTGYSVDSDAGQAIWCHVEQTLGAPHSPALFHVQQEWVKGTAGVLATKTRQAEHALIQAKREWERQSQAPTAPAPNPVPARHRPATHGFVRRNGK